MPGAFFPLLACLAPFLEKPFHLMNEECSRFQIGILNGSRGSNIKYLPYVYTEQGVAKV